MFKLFVLAFVALFAIAAAKPGVVSSYVAPAVGYAAPYYSGAYAAAPYYGGSYYGAGYAAPYYGAAYPYQYGHGLRYVY